MNKTERKAILNSQNHCCPVCTRPLPIGLRQTAYDPKKNTIICRHCAPLVFSFRHITNAIVEYEQSPPRPSPKSEAQQAVEAGRVINSVTGKPYTWEEALIEHPEWAYSGGRVIDKDGNVYSKDGTVIGNTYDGEQK